MGNPEIRYDGSKERLSFDKLKSIYGIIAGSRAMQSDAFLDGAPTSPQLSRLAHMRGKPDPEGVIFDMDGTLVRPYTAITDEVMELLQRHIDDDRKIGIYTNSGHTERLEPLRDIGVEVDPVGLSKPSREGFIRLCDAMGVRPDRTAMIGNSPIADMPLVKEGEDPLFALNILVKSIPPERRDFKSLREYLRPLLFHLLTVPFAKIVCMRNRNLIKGI